MKNGHFPEGIEKLSELSATDEPKPVPTIPWPKPPEEEAFYGIAGDFVRLITPHTESDVAALLVQFLLAFGNVIGRGPYLQVEATKHFTNLFTVLVGNTSRGRKGTSLDHVLAVFEDIDPEWKERRVQSGLSSGEGLVWAIRDAQRKASEDDSKEEELIEGVDDKRLLIVESEFSSVLKQFQREGNTLSSVLRDAWDGKGLQNMTKRQEGKCAKPHVSVIGHITKTELTRYLTATEMANGLGNRFFWVCIKRTKLLPFGGDLDPTSLQSVKDRVSRALAFARGVERVRLADEIRADWTVLYEKLALPKPGVLDPMLARAEPIILRIALLYALLDSQETIQRAHFDAAVALWDYVEGSTRWIFGEATGDRLADRILDIVRTRSGLTQTDLLHALGNNPRAADMDRCKALLIESGLVKIETRTTPTSKKPVSFWIYGTTKHEFNELAPNSSEEIHEVRENRTSYSNGEAPHGLP